MLCYKNRMQARLLASRWNVFVSNGQEDNKRNTLAERAEVDDC